MRYTLWSDGRLIGYTDLDVHTVSRNLRQGFIEPTEDGEPILRDATGVPRAIVIARKARRARGANRSARNDDVFVEACNRREALNLELRDENDETFECDFMRVYDLQDDAGDELAALDEEDDHEREHLHSSSEEEFDTAFSFAATAADIEDMLEQWIQKTRDEEMFHSAWPPPPPPDDRWDTHAYLLQVFLTSALEVDDWL